jgi:hypothetical protein
MMADSMWDPFGSDASLRGKPVLEFYPRLCEIIPLVSEMEFVTYKPEPKLSERLQYALTKQEQELRDAATQICHGNGIPFWDALFGISMTSDRLSERFIEVAFSHRGESPARLFKLKRDVLSPERISSITQELSSNCGLVVSSRVLTKPDNKETDHIPMLDFRCPPSPYNVRAIIRMLTLLGHEHGVLVESGRSYHFYGVKLLSNHEWNQFMSKALLFAPITDPRYIAHRLIDGECRLKVVDSKDGSVPRISDVF